MARFIISHRLAGKTSESKRAASRESLENAAGMLGKFATFAGTESASSKKGAKASGRPALVVEAAAADIEAKRKDMSDDVMVEQEVHRSPAALFLQDAAPGGAAEAAGAASAAGIGALLNLTVNAQGKPLAGASVNVMMNGLSSGLSTMAVAVTGEDGKAAVAYDPSKWRASVAIVVPRENFWGWWQTNPRDGMTLELPALPLSGPVGWWQQVMGVNSYSEKRGEGIKVGVLDTGVGPHPYLKHVQLVGAFVNGNHDASPAAGADVKTHGTHVSGIITARPEAGSGHFGGIVPGAEVFVARVFPSAEEAASGAGSANQGDIANALDEMATTHEVDLVNMSLGGPSPSEVELDAIIAAQEQGTVVLCSAGNSGGPVMYPAAYPQSVAVGALGLLGSVPQGSLAAASLPQAPDRFTPYGLYVGNFSCNGPQLDCVGPGVGIVSTVPSKGRGDVAYADMSGTSMAAPAVTAYLAALLSQDPVYRRLPRDVTRAQRALTVLRSVLYPLGMNPSFFGSGLPFFPVR